MTTFIPGGDDVRPYDYAPELSEPDDDDRQYGNCPVDWPEPHLMTIEDGSLYSCERGHPPTLIANLYRARDEHEWDMVLDMYAGSVADRPLPPPAEVPQVVTGTRPRLITAKDLRNRPSPEYLVEHALAKTGIGQLYGPTYTGKSFVALGLALSVTNQYVDEWFGFRVKLHGPVVYCLMEGVFDFADRIDAWLEAPEHDGATDEGLYILPEQPLNLADGTSLEALERDMAAAGITEPRLIVVDTQALATPGTDENSNTDMGQVLSNIKLLSTKYGCFVLLVHHTGYDQSHSRGASAQRAAMDAELRVVDRTLQVTKVKSYKPSKPKPFDLVASGRSVWARYSDDWQGVLWRVLLAAPTEGMTVAELAAATFDTYADAPEKYDKRVQRQLQRWEKAGTVQKHGRQPARWIAVLPLTRKTDS